MNRLLKITIFIFLMLFLPKVFEVIFLFFEVPFEIYSPYVLWFYIILLFIALLPSVKTFL
jgi:hypothetical protein